jgi:hypothetical protein
MTLFLFQIARRVVANLNREKFPQTTITPVEEPLFPTEELRDLAPTDLKKTFDVYKILARLVLIASHQIPFIYYFINVNRWTGAALTSSSLCMATRWSQALHASTASPSASLPTMAFSSVRARSRAPTSWSCVHNVASRWCSCRTSPASWSASSTRPRASPRTAPRW